MIAVLDPPSLPRLAVAPVPTRSSKQSIFKLVLTWMLLLPLLFFAARGEFSFDRAASGDSASSESNNLTTTRADSNYYRLEQVFMYAIVVIAMAPWINKMRPALRKNRFVFFLPILALLSVLWTQSLIKTLPLAVFTFLLTLFAVYLTERFSPETLIKLFLLVGWAAILLSFVAVVLVPSAGIWNVDGLGAWRGMFIHKNHLGMQMVMLSFGAWCFRPKSIFQRAALYLYILLSTVLIYGSQSRTAWILYAIGISFFVVSRLLKRYPAKERLLIASVLILSFSVIAIAIYSYYAQIAIALGKDPTLTGRTRIWAAVFTALGKRPILGYGYRAFWLGLTGESGRLAFAVGASSLGNSENGILDLWLELGAVGVFLSLVMLFRSIRNAITCFRLGSPGYVHWYVLLIFYTTLSLVDGQKIMYPHTLEWLLFVIAYIGVAKEARRIRLQRSA